MYREKHRRMYKITLEEALASIRLGVVESLYVSDIHEPDGAIHLATDLRVQIDEMEDYNWYSLGEEFNDNGSW